MFRFSCSFGHVWFSPWESTNLRREDSHLHTATSPKGVIISPCADFFCYFHHRTVHNLLFRACIQTQKIPRFLIGDQPCPYHRLSCKHNLTDLALLFHFHIYCFRLRYHFISLVRERCDLYSSLLFSCFPHTSDPYRLSSVRVPHCIHCTHTAKFLEALSESPAPCLLLLGTKRFTFA